MMLGEHMNCSTMKCSYMFDASRADRKFCGAKLDVKKCFDSVSLVQAISPWQHWEHFDRLPTFSGLSTILTPASAGRPHDFVESPCLQPRSNHADFGAY